MTLLTVYPFSVGFEIHIQIDHKKLFCKCNKQWDSPHESLYGTHNKKLYTYLYDRRICNYEKEDALPGPINKFALSVAKTVAKSLGFSVCKHIAFERKHILDGSLTSGFQRTAVVGVNGVSNSIVLSELRLEEQSAKPVKNMAATFNLSRLGVPLLEIVSDKVQIYNHQDLVNFKDTILNVTNEVRKFTYVRGIGSIRQDINIMKTVGKTEIKGFQDIKSLEKLVYAQVEQQITCTKNLNYKIYDTHIEFENTALSEFIFKIHSPTDTLCSIQKTIEEIRNCNFNSTWGIDKMGNFRYMRGRQDSTRYRPQYLIKPIDSSYIKNAPYAIVRKFNNLQYLKYPYTEALHTLDERTHAFIKKYRIEEPNEIDILIEYAVNYGYDAAIDKLYPPFSKHMLTSFDFSNINSEKELIYILSNKYKKNIRDYTAFMNIVKSYALLLWSKQRK